MAINHANMNELIATLKEAPERAFDMDTWGTTVRLPSCGTPACIGGWAEAIARRNGDIVGDGYIFPYKVGDWLGLTGEVSSQLFFPGNYREKTKAQAIRVLEHLQDTGSVDWARFGSAQS